MIHIGVDAHMSFCAVYGLDHATGEVVIEAGHVPTSAAGFAALFNQPWPDAQAVVEASGVSMFVVELLSPFVDEVLLADPKVVRQRVRHSRPKTDMADAQELAFQLAHGLIHPVFQHTVAGLSLRVLTRALSWVTGDSTRLRNRIRSLLRQFGQRCPRRDLCGLAAQEFLAAITLPEPADMTLRALIEQLLSVQAHRVRLQRQLREQARGHELADLLRTMPGVGIQTAMTLISEVGDITRFDQVGSFVNYCGLAPRIEQSGTMRRTGHLIPGNRHLRLALVQAANALGRQKRGETPLHTHHRALVARRGAKTAKLDTARRIAQVAFTIWRSGEPYRYA